MTRWYISSIWLMPSLMVLWHSLQSASYCMLIRELFIFKERSKNPSSFPHFSQQFFIKTPFLSIEIDLLVKSFIHI